MHDIDKWVDDALRRPDSFALFESKPKLFKTWSLGPVIRHRDSDIIQRCNATAMLEELEKNHRDWELIGCSHWAVGHVDHLSFLVLARMTAAEELLVAENKALTSGWAVPSRPGFKLSRVAMFVKKWFEDLEQYPIADETALGQLELEESLEAINDQACSALRHTGLELNDKLPDDWTMQVYDILSRDGKIHAEGSGMYVDDEALCEALQALKFAHLEE